MAFAVRLKAENILCNSATEILFAHHKVDLQTDLRLCCSLTSLFLFHQDSAQSSNQMIGGILLTVCGSMPGIVA